MALDLDTLQKEAEKIDYDLRSPRLILQLITELRQTRESLQKIEIDPLNLEAFKEEKIQEKFKIKQLCGISMGEQHLLEKLQETRERLKEAEEALRHIDADYPVCQDCRDSFEPQDLVIHYEDLAEAYCKKYPKDESPPDDSKSQKS